MAHYKGVINGSDYLLIVDWKYVIYGTTTSLSIANNTKDISCRETDNWKKCVLSNREWGMSFEGKLGFLYDNGTLNTVHTIPAGNVESLLNKAYFDDDRKVTVLLYPIPIVVPFGDPMWAGEAFITDLSIDTPMEDSASVSFNLMGCDELDLSYPTI